MNVPTSASHPEPTVPVPGIKDAGSYADTPFDYIIVGSGAGGGPLAARLAENGMKVLLLEAGSEFKGKPVYDAPGYHAASTEAPEMAWDFETRHYTDTDQQKRDPKAMPVGEDSARVFYPRCSAVGGCTAHHAMVTAYGCEPEWEHLAALTNDSSWRADRMRRYFQRIESCTYRLRPGMTIHSAWKLTRAALNGTYQPARPVRRWLEVIAAWFRSVARYFVPSVDANTGKHGFDGWLKTDLIDPTLAVGDFRLVKLIISFLRLQWTDDDNRFDYRKFWGTLFGFFQSDGLKEFDPNDQDTAHNRTRGVALIPVSTNDGRRHGVRERLAEVVEKHPANLVIVEKVFVRELLFDPALSANGVPKVIGVSYWSKQGIYRAHVKEGQQPRPADEEAGQAFARREIILCGGTFNTPQLLMLSGIGPKEHLSAVAPSVPCRVNLPGVGMNLQDRYEVAVISPAKKKFDLLNNATFDPNDTQGDKSAAAWNKNATGLYSSNGGALAVIDTSKFSIDREIARAKLQSREPQPVPPDLFLFAFPAAFRGYYHGWSKDLLYSQYTPGKPHQGRRQQDLFSWVVLKARSHNHGGTVRLVSSDICDPPDIVFRSLREGHYPAGCSVDDDLEPLLNGVKLALALNDSSKAFKPAIQPPPGADDARLKQWICDEAWGHHACGTCRIGADKWREDVSQLQDKNAVLDTRFRVHGVCGLRVVDASVFPRIPGFFIVTPIYMISEKAADVLLEDAAYA